MSRSVFHVFCGNTRDRLIEWGNGWGSAPLIWDTLIARYRSAFKSSFPYEQWGELWDLVKKRKILPEPHELLVLRFTYDNALVGRDTFLELADALEKFNQGCSAKRVNHLPGFASALRELFQEEAVTAVGLQATTVSDSPWAGRYVEEVGDLVRCDLSETLHWFISSKPVSKVQAEFATLEESLDEGWPAPSEEAVQEACELADSLEEDRPDIQLEASPDAGGGVGLWLVKDDREVSLGFHNDGARTCVLSKGKEVVGHRAYTPQVLDALITFLDGGGLPPLNDDVVSSPAEDAS